MISFLLFIYSLCLYVPMQMHSIYAGDSGELIAAAYTWSIAHPPGYPLYMLFGGLLSHYFPFGPTVAWKIGLLSSIPMAMATVFIYKIVMRVCVGGMTKNFSLRSKNRDLVFLSIFSRVAGVSAAVGFSLLYPVWLYAIAPEVFGLFALFLTSITYVFLQWVYTKQHIYLYVLTFLMGLSLTHHHLIVVLFGAMGIWIYQNYKLLITNYKFSLQIRKNAIICIVLFLLGFGVYAYAPIASSYLPPIDWERPTTIQGFIRLVTRASYGTFRASFGVGQSMTDRLLNLLTLGQYIWKDFSVIGIFFSIMGMFFLWIKRPHVRSFFFTFFLLSLFYFFYAGFPVSSNFSLGTLERFFILPYVVITVCVGFGIYMTLSLCLYYWQTHADRIHIPFIYIAIGICAAGCFWIVRSFGLNYRGMAALTYDTTLERLADDILQDVPAGAIVSGFDDLSTFALDYAYFVQRKRPDIYYLYLDRLLFPHYRAIVHKQFPTLVLPPAPAIPMDTAYLSAFIQSNASFPIFLERMPTYFPEFWVPHGLLVRYYPDLSVIPDRIELLIENDVRWNHFQHISLGALGQYKHMMLADIYRYYANRRLVYAQALLLMGNVPKAQTQMYEAIQYDLSQYDLYSPYLLVLLEKKACGEASQLFSKLYSHVSTNTSFRLAYSSFLTTCPTEATQDATIRADYEQMKRQGQVKIE